MPSAIYQSGKRLLTDPVGSFYEKPITTALDVASVQPLFGVAKTAGTSLLRAGGQKAVSMLGKPMGKRLMSATLGPTEEAITARMTRPKSILKAKSSADIGDDLAGSMGDIEKQIRTGSEAASKTLNPDLFNSSGVQQKATIVRRITSLQNELKEGGSVIGEANQLAFNKLEGIKTKVKAMNDGFEGLFNERIPETNVEGIIKAIDPDINYDVAVNSVANEKLMRLRTELDNALKRRNPGYRKAMQPVAERMKTYEGVKKKFNLRKGEKGELRPDNATASNLEMALNEKKSVSQDLLGQVKNFTGKDYLQQVRDWKVSQQFQPGATRPNGSRRVNLGGMVGSGVGAVVGGWPGAAIGSVIGGVGGAYLDKQGGAIAAKLIDMYLKNKGAAKTAVKVSNPVADQYAPLLLDAVEKTGITLEEASANLRKMDPGYGKILLQLISPDTPPSEPKPKPLSIFRKSAKAEPERILDRETAKDYLAKADGDKDLARQMAKRDGWRVV